MPYDRGMRIHSNTLTTRDIYDACRVSGTAAPILERKGSRTRDHAFEVQLSGDSPYRSQGHGDYAATWDQWGVFFAYLFDTDPGMVAGNKSWGYDGAYNFHRKTANRFHYSHPERRFPDDTHPRHKWQGDGTGNGQYCKKCTAKLLWS